MLRLYFRWSDVHFHFKSRKLLLLNWPDSETKDIAHMTSYFVMKDIFITIPILITKVIKMVYFFMYLFRNRI